MLLKERFSGKIISSHKIDSLWTSFLSSLIFPAQLWDKNNFINSSENLPLLSYFFNKKFEIKTISLPLYFNYTISIFKTFILKKQNQIKQEHTNVEEKINKITIHETISKLEKGLELLNLKINTSDKALSDLKSKLERIDVEQIKKDIISNAKKAFDIELIIL